VTTRTKEISINGSTRQGTKVDYASAVNVHGKLAINTVEEVALYPNHNYRDLETGEVIHNVVFVPVEHEQHTKTWGRPIIGGWEIHHIDCDQCAEDGTVGRVDSFIFAERIHIGPAIGVDLRDVREVIE